jgi:serine/threonine protein kinase
MIKALIVALHIWFGYSGLTLEEIIGDPEIDTKLLEASKITDQYTFESNLMGLRNNGNLYSVSEKQSGNKYLIKLAKVIKVNILREDNFDPCSSYNIQKKLSETNKNIFKLKEVIRIGSNKENHWLCALVMDFATKSFKNKIFDEPVLSKESKNIFESLIKEIMKGFLELHLAGYILFDIKSSNILLFFDENGHRKAAINDFDDCSLIRSLLYRKIDEISERINQTYLKIKEVLDEILVTNGLTDDEKLKESIQETLKSDKEKILMEIENDESTQEIKSLRLRRKLTKSQSLEGDNL